MSNALNMSLDDLIKNNKKSGGGNRKGKRRGSSGLGPNRRQTKRSGNRPAPYPLGKAPESAWQQDMHSDRMLAYPSPATRVSSLETGSKIYISNLDYGVSNEDIKELFSEFGDLKRFSINYDRSGRSKGTAEVVFAKRVDALAAVKRYNDVQLDGKPMKIEIVGANMEKPAAITRISEGRFGNSNIIPKRLTERVGSTGSRRRRQGGRGRAKDVKQVSASDLDADLDKYHAQAMQE